VNPHTIHVLLIEDDEQDYAVTKKLLAATAPEQDFVLWWVDRLDDGLRTLGEGGIDVVLVDFALPDAQGWFALERIRARAPSVPIILLTGTDDESMGIRALKEGAQDYLFKGRTDGSLLVRAIRYAIERKAVELSLKQYHDHLEDLVADRTAALSLANTQLEREIADRKKAEDDLRMALEKLREHDKAQSDFVSNVSHELKTPLASMSYAVENLLKGVVGPLSERVRKYLLMVQEDASRLTTTINDILDMSRIDAKKFVLKRVKMPFSRFLYRAVESLRIQAEIKGIALCLEVRDGDSFVACDPQRMERVVLNIVQNAIKFTDSGGRIDVVATPDSARRMLVLDVIDDGIGIPFQQLQRVTERYYRVGEHVSGAGIGLSLSKDIVDLHQGRLEVRSPPEGRARGTQVSICLPTVGPPSVLAVGADPSSTDWLKAQLAAQNYAVTVCADESEALGLVLQHKTDLVLLDQAPATHDGLALISHIRANPDLQHIPIVVATDGNLDGTRREVFHELRVSAIGKPWRPAALLECIEKALFFDRGNLV
jgi:signal transduction histidine kinase